MAVLIKTDSHGRVAADVELNELEEDAIECGVGGCKAVLRSNAGDILYIHTQNTYRHYVFTHA